MQWMFKPVAAAIGLNIGRSAAQLAEERINAMDVSAAQRCRGGGCACCRDGSLEGEASGLDFGVIFSRPERYLQSL